MKKTGQVSGETPDLYQSFSMVLAARMFLQNNGFEEVTRHVDGEGHRFTRGVLNTGFKFPDGTQTNQYLPPVRGSDRLIPSYIVTNDYADVRSMGKRDALIGRIAIEKPIVVGVAHNVLMQTDFRKDGFRVGLEINQEEALSYNAIRKAFIKEKVKTLGLMKRAKAGVLNTFWTRHWNSFNLPTSRFTDNPDDSWFLSKIALSYIVEHAKLNSTESELGSRLIDCIDSDNLSGNSNNPRELARLRAFIADCSGDKTTIPCLQTLAIPEYFVIFDLHLKNEVINETQLEQFATVTSGLDGIVANKSPIN